MSGSSVPITKSCKVVLEFFLVSLYAFSGLMSGRPPPTVIQKNKANYPLVHLIGISFEGIGFELKNFILIYYF